MPTRSTTGRTLVEVSSFLFSPYFIVFALTVPGATCPSASGSEIRVPTGFVVEYWLRESRVRCSKIYAAMIANQFSGKAHKGGGAQKCLDG
jgi:hypothetical protein